TKKPAAESAKTLENSNIDGTNCIHKDPFIKLSGINSRKSINANEIRSIEMVAKTTLTDFRNL
ncbi:MAG TPA: hypothetical protein VJ939_09885, partial [Bacteroidales bacterium]|nr:hypothetical protein [Bacteroidales bacterium]